MADQKRKTHVERTYGKNENDDCWLDLEILDELVEDGDGGQRTIRHFACKPKRKSNYLRVKNPEDEDQHVEIAVWDEYKATDVQRSFANCKGPTTRNVTVKRITNRNIADEFLDGGFGGKPPRDPDIYKKAIEKSKDSNPDQYVCFEVIKQSKETGTGKHGYGADDSSPVIGQTTNHHIAICNSDLIPKTPANGDAKKQKCGKKEPVRIDPLQWIVNVSWGGLAVIFGDKANDAPDPPPKKEAA